MVTPPCVALRIWAITLSDLILYCFTQSAIGDCDAAWLSRKIRTPRPSKKAIPKPSEWQSVRPARRRKPSKEKTISVGVLQFIPSNWHINSYNLFLYFYNLIMCADLTP